MAQVLMFAVEFQKACSCCQCGVPIVVEGQIEAELRRSHRSFWCINGHQQSFRAKSETEALRDQLADRERQLSAERERAATNFALRQKAEREVSKLRKRAKNGICPCCKRTFKSLARHMSAKHPDFADGAL